MRKVEFITLNLTLVLFVVETVAYLARAKWYFTLGPALLRQHWQTSASVDDTVEAVNRASASLKLAIRRSGSFFLMRFKWWEFSTWPRLLLRIDPSPHGALLTYEVRPFLSPVVIVLAGLLLFRSGWLGIFSMSYFFLCAILYVIGWWYETRKLKSLKPLRDQLAQLGLTICSNCGYDRFRLPTSTPCPECGHQERPPIVAPP